MVWTTVGDGTHYVGEVVQALPVELDWVHEVAQLELDAPTDRQPVQLKKARRNMLALAKVASTQRADQASSGVLHALQWCDLHEW